MKDFRDSNPGAARGRDPFADLVRAVEGSGVRSTGVAQPVYAGFEPVEVPQAAGWDEFTYEPAQSVRAPEAPRERQLASPRLDAVGALASSAGKRPAARSGGEADLQIEDALRGLSKPQRPRDTIPAETQSFAPARELEPDQDHRQTLTLDDFDELIASELAAMETSRPVHDDDEDYALGFDDVDVDPAHYDDYPVRTRSRFRAPATILGGMAAMALVGVAAVALYAGMPGMAADGGGPLLIKADAEPYKIAPADPGGRSIPNQNKAVYQRVAGVEAERAPMQQSLVTAMEEPMEIAEDEEPPVDALPGVSIGDDVALPSEAPGEAEGVADAAAPAAEADATLQPRKVRTLIVRPDGTLVTNESASTESSLMTEASNTVAQAAMLDPVAGIAPAMPFDGDAADLTTASVSAPASPEPAPEPAPAAKAPPAPVAKALPEQKVAALEPAAPAPAASGGYFVQISSQPTQALAAESMANLGKRYSSTIGGRGLSIKAAEIAGKGTFYRVRVAAASKGEANSLCDSLKSAGGSCFVTR